MSYTYTPKARVQKPAPHFAGTAVVDGIFEGTPSALTLPAARAVPLYLQLADGDCAQQTAA